MITIRPLLTLMAIAAFASPAFAKQPAMHRAEELTKQAHEVLQNDATADKGGHRVKAMHLLKQALDEIQAGKQFDNQNVSANENKKAKKKN